mmetsp:Transcript_95525/g.169623  ORF Transcript_95525/g.169623 Transcript_95525/m.169623 type:complete len:530 (-) Transcript_95525:124-1713(-)
MVRSSSNRCLFCEYQHPRNHFLELFGSEAYSELFGSEALTHARNDLERAGKPLELEDGEVDSHITSPGHLISLAAMLRNRTECDRILRRLRPSESQKQLLQKCKAELQRVLKPAAIWWTGSIGKGTSLSGSHDVDVCVSLGGGYVDMEHAVREIASRLQHSAIEVRRVEKKLVFALFKTCIGGDSCALELDILPNFEFGQAQVRHWKVFSEMNAAQKDSVRILKAWSRLSLKTPGILLEAVVHQSLPCASVASDVQGYFIEALRALSSRCQWPDPTDRTVDLGRSLQPEAWQKLQGLAKDTLVLCDVKLEPSDWCKQSYPCIHGLNLIDGDGRRHDFGERDGYGIVEIYTRLSLRIPPHFKDYPKVKDHSHRQDVCGKDCLSFWGEEMLMDEHRRRSIQLGDRYLELVKKFQDESHPLVVSVMQDAESLMAECSGHPSTKIQEQSAIVAMLFSWKVEEAGAHLESAKKEQEQRNRRVAAMRAEERRASEQAAVHHQHNQEDVRDSSPCETMIIAIVLLAAFVQWLLNFH